MTPARDRSLRIVASPAGALRAEATAAGVTALHPVAVVAPGTIDERVGPGEEHLDLLERELAAYARGELREFRTTLDLEGAGVRTAFRREAYREMTRIPFGTTVSYRQVAEDAGSPLGARAVGGFCRDTPMILLVPVHRVIRSDGTTVGCKGEDRAALLAHDVRRWAGGHEPATWSATLRVEASLAVSRREWLRHPQCGCAWSLPA